MTQLSTVSELKGFMNVTPEATQGQLQGLSSRSVREDDPGAVKTPMLVSHLKRVSRWWVPGSVFVI